MNKLKELRKSKNLTQIDMAKIFHITQASYSLWESGKTKIDNASLERLSEMFEVSIDYILGKAEKEISSVRIPVLGRIPAGIPIEAVEEILDYEEITPEIARTGEYFALKVQGDSMAPQIMNGDVLIIKKQDSAESGDVCVVFVNGDDATLKKIQKDENGIALIPNNPAYGIRYFTNKEIQTLPVRVVGKAVEVRRSLV